MGIVAIVLGTLITMASLFFGLGEGLSGHALGGIFWVLLAIFGLGMIGIGHLGRRVDGLDDVLRWQTKEIVRQNELTEQQSRLIQFYFERGAKTPPSQPAP